MISSTTPDTYELLFAAEGGAHGVTFHCDAHGRVDLDKLE